MQPTPGNQLVPTGQMLDPSMATGLEDFDVSDLRLPRLSIDHDKGGYVDSLNPELAMPKISVIPCGLIKQRVMWPALMTDDNGDANPMCKSTDFRTGYPNMISKDQRELFPWNATPGWHPDNFPKDEAGRVTLPCDSCRLNTWGSHPDGKKTWCSEQHAIVVLYAPYDDTPGAFNSEPSMLALFTAQRSSINASKAFFGGIARQQMPTFAFKAVWSLRAEQRGKNTYYVPNMTIVGRTDQADWPQYQAPYVEVRQFITQPPRVRDDQQQANVSGQQMNQYNQMPQQQGGFQNNTWAPGQPQQNPQVINAQPVYQQPVQPVQQQAPVQPQYVQQAPPNQYAQPVQQQAPQVQQAPVVQQMPPAPPAQQAPATADLPFAAPVPVSAAPAQPVSSPTPGRDDDELPF